MADLRLFGATSNLIRFSLKNSSTGAPLTGLTGSSSGLIIGTIADVESVTTTYTQAASHIQTIAALGTYAAPSALNCRFGEVDAVNHPGLYEFQFADARFAVTNAKRLVVSVSGAANLLATDYEIELVQFNPFDGARLGLSSIPNANPGAANGMLISGSNAGTTTFGAITCTGTFTISDGVAITRSSSNSDGLAVTGSGTGKGLNVTGGTTGDGATFTAGGGSHNGITATGTGSGQGVNATGGSSGAGMNIGAGGGSVAGLTISGTSSGLSITGSTNGITISAGGNGDGINISGAGSGSGIKSAGGTTGAGAKFIGGGTSGVGVSITTTSGDGLSIIPTAGNAITATGNGTSKHGFLITGGTAGTSDGLKCVAGTGGVDVRGNITGNITGTLDTVTNVTNFGGVWDVTLSSHLTAGSTGAALNSAGSGTAPTAAQIATAVWQDLTAGSDFLTVGSIGKLLVTNIDTTISSRSTFAGGAVSSVTGNVGGNVTGSVGSVVGNVGGNVTGSVGSVVGAVTVGTNNDKTGYGLAASGLDLVVVEVGLNARQALAIISAAEGGVVAGGNTSNITIAAASHPATNRITATVDGNGNRSVVTLNPPA